MRILISPTKTMKPVVSVADTLGTPVFIEKTEEIQKAVQHLSLEEAKFMWQCNDKLARINYDRFQHMNLMKENSPAVELYDGLQFKYMHVDTMKERETAYLQSHLRILSGFYGILRPFDGIVPYRLEMQARISVGGAKNLYEFWGRHLYEEAIEEDHVLIQLASKEYAKCIEPYADSSDRIIQVEFFTEQNGKRRQQSTYAKMGRGEMVHFLAEKHAQTPDAMKDFAALGFAFDETNSDEQRFVFVRQAE